MGTIKKVTINKMVHAMVFQTLKALVGSSKFHGVMAGCLECQRAYITEKKERGGNKKGEQKV